MIYAIGDSHSSLFGGSVCENYIQPQYAYDYIIREGKFIKLHEGTQSKFIANDPNFISIRSGAQTAYNMIDKTDLIDEIIREYKISKTNDYILFCYGEIDTRVHIGKQEDIQQVDAEIIIKDLTQRYFRFLCKYRDQGYKILVWGVPPSGHGAHDAHPRYSTHTQRNVLSKRINQYFKESCNTHNIEFISIWEDIAERNVENYFSYFLDAIHLSYPPCKELIDNKFKRYY